MNRFRQRMPNFIYHNPADLLDMEFEDLSELMDTDFYRWYTNNPNFSHFAIGSDVWFEDTSHPIRPLLAIWTDLEKTPSWCGWFDKPDEVDLPEW